MKLLTPFTVGSLSVPNRVWMAPLTRVRADLPRRFLANAPLNPVREDKLYTEGPEGYTDYPALVA